MKFIKSMKTKALAVFTVLCMLAGSAGVYAVNGEDSTSQSTYTIRFVNKGAVDGATVYYSTGSDAGFMEVSLNSTEIDSSNNSSNQVGAVTLSTDVQVVSVKAVLKDGYKLDTTRGVTLRGPMTPVENKGGNAEGFLGDIGLTYNLAELVGVNEYNTLAGKQFELEFGFENVQNSQGGSGQVPPSESTGTGDSDQNQQRTVSVDFGTFQWEVKGETVTATVDGSDSSESVLEMTYDRIIKLDGYNPETMIVKVTASDGFNVVLPVTDGTTSLSAREDDGGYPNGTLVFSVEARNSENPEPGDHPVDSLSKVTLNGDVAFRINDSNYIENLDEQTGVYEVGFNRKVNDDGTELDTVDIGISWRINRKLESLIIDGKDYSDLIPQNRQAYLDACIGQMYEVMIPDVPYQETYEITGWTAEFSEGEMPIGNFLWTYNPDHRYQYGPDGDLVLDENGNAVLNDDYLDHGRMELIQVKMEDGTIYAGQKLQEMLAEGSAFSWGDPQDGGFGEAVLPAGVEVTVKLIPEYGYQLTSFGVNGGTFEADDKQQSVYSFVIKGGNFHLGARFTEVKDEVVTKTDSIMGGDIILGENEIDTGSVVLSVDTAENADRTGFDSAVKQDQNLNGYAVESIVDINLNQVVYKGNDNVDDAWKTSMSTLQNKAQITLELQNYYDDVTVIHEKHDGNGNVVGYEVLATEYNAENNTLMFETDSFSNYAIVTTERKIPVFVNYDPMDEGEGALAHASVQIGKDGQETEVAGWDRLLLNQGEEAVFTLSQPKMFTGSMPVVEVLYHTGQEEPVIQYAQLKSAGQDNLYTFTLPAYPENCDTIEVMIFWSEFEYLNPDEDQVMYYIAIEDSSETSGDTIRFNVEPIASASFGNEAKYIFSKDQNVVLEIANVPGRRLLTATLDFETTFAGAMAETTEPVRDIAELYKDGTYQITDEYFAEDPIRDVVLTFVPCMHTYTDDNGQEATWIVTDAGKQATCTEDGLTEGQHCTECTEVISEQKVIEAAGHKPSEERVNVKAATCTEEGYTGDVACSVCNELIEKGKVIEALGHEEVIDAGKDPTCTEEGLTEGKHCSRCNEVLVKQEVIEALGHEEVIDAAKEATCTEEGLTEGKHCSRCNEVLIEQKVIEAKGHSPSEEKVNVKAATCTEEGYTGDVFCTVCNELVEKGKIIPSTGHSYDNHVCSICHEIKKGYAYFEFADGSGKEVNKAVSFVETKSAYASEAGKKYIAVNVQVNYETQPTKPYKQEVKVTSATEKLGGYFDTDTGIYHVKPDNYRHMKVDAVIHTAGLERKITLEWLPQIKEEKPTKPQVMEQEEAEKIVLDQEAEAAVNAELNGDNSAVKSTISLKVSVEDVQTVMSSGGKIRTDLVSTSKLQEDSTVLTGSQQVTGNVICVLDVTIPVFVEKAGQPDLIIGNMTVLSEPKQFVVELPELPSVAEGYERIFTVYRDHEGEVDHFTATLDANGNLVVTSNLFSEYVITYRDVPVSSGSETTGRPVVDTSDHTQNVLWISLMLVSALAAVSIIRFRKRCN